MSGYATLEEALANGRGIERPFRCPEHDDTHASASVNVAKGLWVCYVCRARGRVDGKRVPTDNELDWMLKPEIATRLYPQSYLDLFGVGGYWETRFPRWLCWAMQMGTDPVSGDGTFPVFTPQGQLAGVGRRHLEGEVKYRYPYTWAASRTLGCLELSRVHSGVIVLVEGRADAAALWEVGIPAYACWGAGIHHHQVEQVARLAPATVLLGFDMDEAGDRACAMTAAALADLCECARVDWLSAGVKDPADAEPSARTAAVAESVRTTTDTALDQHLVCWADTQSRLEKEYANREE